MLCWQHSTTFLQVDLVFALADSSMSQTIALAPTAPTQRKRPPNLTPDQRKAVTQRSREAAARLEADLSEWYDGAVEFSKTLSERHGKKADYYLRLMFSGAARVRNSRKPSAFNAWGHHLAKNAHEGKLQKTQ